MAQAGKFGNAKLYGLVKEARPPEIYNRTSSITSSWMQCARLSSDNTSFRPLPTHSPPRVWQGFTGKLPEFRVVSPTVLPTVGRRDPTKKLALGALLLRKRWYDDRWRRYF